MYQTSSAQVDVESPGGAVRVIPFGAGGRGVAARRRIQSGELIERAPVIVVPEQDRPAVDASSVGSYIFMWEHDSTGEDLYSQRGRAAVILGFGSLLNHSADPNCMFIRYIEALAVDLIALRDIEAGEELRFDYGMTLWFDPE